MLSPKISNKASMSLLTTPVRHCAGSHNKYNKKRKGSKHYTDYKEGIKQFCFADDIIVCLIKVTVNWQKKKKNPGTKWL